MPRGTDWCEMCGGLGFVGEYDRDWSPAMRYRLFKEGRTAICPTCDGSGAGPRRWRSEAIRHARQRRAFEAVMIIVPIALAALGFVAYVIAWAIAWVVT